MKTTHVMTGSLRVLFLTSIPRWGGGERWMLDSAAGLAARGHEVLLAGRPGAPVVSRARRVDVPTCEVRMGGDLDPRALLGVKALLLRHRPDAVFVNIGKELRYVCLATLVGKRPLLFARCGSDDPLKSGPIERYTHGRRLTRLLTNSTTLARTRLTSWLPPDSVRVIPNGVPLGMHLSVATRAEMRRDLGLPTEVPLVVHVGELEPRKGQETTLRALAALWARHTTASLGRTQPPYVAFVGSGGDERRLRALCHQLGMDDFILWIGFRDDVERYLSVADVLVLPSRSEGVPWTLLEAMANHLPVIASRVSGIPEVVQNGVTGLLVPPDDPPALADALDLLLHDHGLAARLSAAGFESVKKDWNREDMLSDLECLLYAHLLRRRSAERFRPALFVAREGTLVRRATGLAAGGSAELESKAARALRWLRDAGFAVVVVGGHSGAAAAPSEEKQLDARLRELLRAQDVEVDAFCPWQQDGTPAGAVDREPEPFLRAAREFDLDLSRSVLVSNAARQLEAGVRAGIMTLGYSPPSDAWLGPVAEDWMAVARNLLLAAFLRRTST